MVTITINLENGIEAADACCEVARMIENGYTSGMIGCSGDTFDIEGDIFSDDEEDVVENEVVNEVEEEDTPTESGKTEVRITTVESHCYTTSYHGEAVVTSRACLTELFGEDNGIGDKTNHDWALLFDVKYREGVSEQFGIDLYDWKYGEMPEDAIIYWNIGSNNVFDSSTAREVIDMLISGQLEDYKYKIIEVKKK